MRSILSLLSLSLLMTVASPAQADSNMLIILDASNSMWGQVDKTAKIETARGVLGDLVADLPADLNVGLMAYGHGDKESCTDVAMLTPIAKLDATGLKKSIKDIKPKGKTPIAYSIEKAGAALGKYEGQNNSIVLISDGIETCEGDPCAAAEKLAAQNINTKVHVVGFNVDAAAKKQLECIAKKGNGQYFNADSTEGFKTAIAEVRKVAEPEPEPAPAPKVTETYFEDSFDGGELSESWEVNNPDPNNFIVENGELLIVMNDSVEKGINDEDAPNLFTLAKPMPDKDWEIEATFSMEVNTGEEMFFVGVMDDAKNHLTVGVYTNQQALSCFVYGIVIKMEGGAKTFHESVMFKGDGGYGVFDPCNKAVNDFGDMTVKLRKTGRDYSASVVMGKEGTDNYKSVDLEPLKMLRAKSKLVVSLGQWDNPGGSRKKGGETSVHLKDIKVSTIK